MVIIGFQQIDVAFIDYNMAGKNGLELLAEMRALNINIPTAVITANLQREITDRTRALKATFVPKPITLKYLHPLLGLFSRAPHSGPELLPL